MNADTNMVTNTAIMMRFQDWVTKMSLNPTALKKSMAPTVKVCTKASMPAMMPAFALDPATTITIIAGSSKIFSGMTRGDPDQVAEEFGWGDKGAFCAKFCIHS